jgi:hypothetical protein
LIRSDPLRCFRSQEQWAPLDVGIAFPITQAEIDAWIGADAYLVGRSAHFARSGR